MKQGALEEVELMTCGGWSDDGGHKEQSAGGWNIDFAKIGLFSSNFEWHLVNLNQLWINLNLDMASLTKWNVIQITLKNPILLENTIKKWRWIWH